MRLIHFDSVHKSNLPLTGIVFKPGLAEKSARPQICVYAGLSLYIAPPSIGSLLHRGTYNSNGAECDWLSHIGFYLLIQDNKGGQDAANDMALSYASISRRLGQFRFKKNSVARLDPAIGRSWPRCRRDDAGAIRPPESPPPPPGTPVARRRRCAGRFRRRSIIRSSMPGSLGFRFYSLTVIARSM